MVVKVISATRLLHICPDQTYLDNQTRYFEILQLIASVIIDFL